MSGDVIIRAEGLGKRYRLGVRPRYKALRDTLTDLAAAPFRLGRWLAAGAAGAAGDSGPRWFWALEDVSFEIRRGEVVGIIGRNGAGKSTLLKILSRITEPTVGRAELRGRVGSLLEVGTGFHPELTGRENIYLNGAILGMGHRAIRARFDQIVAFAEVERFVDTPVKHYSSGMYLRLAFAVAAHLEPDILLVDEVLAVGDAQFQKKCLGKMHEIAHGGRTVLYVSHNMPSVINLCSQVIQLHGGRLVLHGAPREVVQHYLAGGASQAEAEWPDVSTAPGDDDARLVAARVLQDGIEGPAAEVDIAREVRIEIVYRCLRDGVPLYAALWLRTRTGVDVLSSTNGLGVSLVDDPWYGKAHPAGVYRSVCRIPAHFLNDDAYTVTAIVGRVPHRTIALKEDVVAFRVLDTGEMRKEYYGAWFGAVRPRLAWATEPLASPAPTAAGGPRT